MAAGLDEHTSFFDTSGTPLTGGEVFIGTVGLEPEANPITIYSDRELTTILANPQTIDAYGRATTKIWIPAEYSMKVTDSDDVQQYINLENGTAESTGITKIIAIAGTANAITGEATPTPISAYSDGETYIFTAISANTGAVTLNWDGVGAKALVYDFDIPLEQGHIQVDQVIEAIYGSDDDTFQWGNPNRKIVFGNEGASIASAATVELGDATGNSLDVTGTTTITSFGTTPDGSVYWLTFSGILIITYNVTSLLIPAQANYTTTAGDVVRVQSLGSGNNSIQIFKEDGLPVTNIPVATQAQQETGTELDAFVAPGVQEFHQSACKAWVYWNASGVQAIIADYNVVSIADGGVGLTQINWDNDFSSANYVWVGGAKDTSTQGRAYVSQTSTSTRAASNVVVSLISEASGTLTDLTANSVAAFGDQ